MWVHVYVMTSKLLIILLTIEPVKFSKDPKVVTILEQSLLCNHTNLMHTCIRLHNKLKELREGWLYVSYKMNPSKKWNVTCHFKCMYTSTSSCWTIQLLKWLAILHVKLGFDTTLTTIMSNSLVTQIEQSGKDLHVCTVRHPCM